MSAALEKANRERVRHLKRSKTDSAKRSRIALKQARREEHEAQKRWVKSQAIQHDYGSSDDESASDQEADRLLSSADGSSDEECASDQEADRLLSSADGSSDEECASDQEADRLLSSADSVADGVVVTSSVTKCKCGSVTHKRTNHRDCPLNKQGSSAAVPSASTATVPSTSTATVPSTSTATCKCGSLSHKRTSHRDCPLNKHHQV